MQQAMVEPATVLTGDMRRQDPWSFAKKRRSRSEIRLMRLQTVTQIAEVDFGGFHAGRGVCCLSVTGVIGFASQVTGCDM